MYSRKLWAREPNNIRMPADSTLLYPLSTRQTSSSVRWQPSNGLVNKRRPDLVCPRFPAKIAWLTSPGPGVEQSRGSWGQRSSQHTRGCRLGSSCRQVSMYGDPTLADGEPLGGRRWTYQWSCQTAICRGQAFVKLKDCGFLREILSFPHKTTLKSLHSTNIVCRKAFRYIKH